jgi:acetylornithine/succinyldiaminopimelate/putrescine aminotransferase/predicted amino acid dehydrogenase
MVHHRAAEDLVRIDAGAHTPANAVRQYERSKEDFRAHVNPHLSALLQRLSLDKCFVRGEGSLLYDEEGTAYLDAVSGYGAVPFGHNPEFLWEALQAVHAAREPAMAQPSLQPGAGDLAAALLAHAPPGLQYVTFASSGTEAVEAAIKACRLATGRLGIISTENGFHGKTLGALSATGRDYYQKDTGAPSEGFRRVPYGDVDALEEAFEKHGAETAAFIVEPIQGEGGVVEAPAGYLKLVRRLCDRHGVLMIVDEIQTGLGRTGELFACTADHVSPDVLTLAKALGGGLMPVSACLLSPKAYSKAFARRHSSTFAGNALAMRVGLRVLEQLTQEDGRAIEQVCRQGAYLKRGLQALQREFPREIREVRGRGLMLGVQLGGDHAHMARGHGSMMHLLEETEGLAVLAASYLLNVEHVRVAPTMNAGSNGGNVLRVQPPLNVSRAECDKIIAAFRQLASVLAAGRSDQLIAHLVREPEEVEVTTGVFERAEVRRLAQEAEPGRFAFVAHLLDSNSLADFDSSLDRLAPGEVSAFVDQFEEMAKPFWAARMRIESKAQHVAVGDFIAIPKTAQQLLKLTPAEAIAEVGYAVDLAKKRGAKIVGLGGYTSVITQNLRPLLKLGVPLTTGNSYTVVSAVDAAVEAARASGRPLEDTRATIVGGGGSIGSALAGLLAEHVPELTLVTRESDPASMRSRYAVVLGRMLRHFGRRRREGVEYHRRSLAYTLSRLQCVDWLSELEGRMVLNAEAESDILEQVAHLPIRWTTELGNTVSQSDMVFLVTSSPEELVKSEMVRPGTVICDLSRPANVGPELMARKDVLVIDGGVIEVPGKPDLGWHFGCPPGVAFACMAETMMLGLEQRYEHTSLGRDLQEDVLASLRSYATKHGFKLAELRSQGRPLDLSTWRDRLVESAAAPYLQRRSA